MNAQRRDLLIATAEVLKAENAVLLCSDCDNEAKPFSCYCQECEDALYEAALPCDLLGDDDR